MSGQAARALPSPRAVLEERLALKVLDAWLQNRHQTLEPLTVNLRRLDPVQRLAVLRMVAVAITSARSSPERSAATRSWLALAGADDAALAALDRALARPPALSEALRELSRRHVEALAYAACVAALDAREPANRLFLDFLAARLVLPASAVRGISRRFRQ